MYKRMLVIFIVAFAYWLHAEQKSINLAYSSTDFEYNQTDSGGLIKHMGNNNIAYINPPGAPNLPMHLLMVSVPIEAEFQSVSFSYETADYRTNVSLYPTQAKIPVSTECDTLQFIEPDLAYYTMNQFPADLCVYVSTHIMRTYKVFCFQVSPFIYFPMTHDLKLITSGVMSISYSLTFQPNPDSWDDGSRAALVRKLVINPDDVLNSPLRQPLEDEVKYLVITDGNWISEDTTFPENDQYFQPFIDWKTRKGLKAEIVTIQSIYTSYSGATPQEKIKRCIDYYHKNKRTEWVLLYGSQEIIPAPLCLVSMSSDEFLFDFCNIETDLFYACLDGNYLWNYDATHDRHSYSQDVDLLPELSIGRVAINEFSTYSNNYYLRKVKSYEQMPPVSSFAQKALLTGAFLFDDSVSSSPRSDTDWICEGMWSNYMQPYWSGGSRDRLYDTSSDLGNLTSNSLSNAIGSGYNIILESSHGNTQRWAIEWDWDSTNWNYFGNGSVPSSNGFQNKFGLLYSIACLTNYFGPVGSEPYPWGNGNSDSKSLGTAFLASEGGSVAYIGNTSYGIGNRFWTPANSFDDWGPSWDYAKRFFPSLFSGFPDSRTSLGLCFDLSKALMIPAVNQGFDDYETFIMFSLNLQGDPELNILTADPTEFNISLPANLFWDEQGVQNTLAVNTGVPFASVCVSNGADVYDTHSADANGYARFDISPRSSNPLQVMITGRNKIPYYGQIPVVPANIRGTVELNENPNLVIYTRIRVYDTSGNMVTDTSPNVNGQFILGVNPGSNPYYLQYELLRPDQNSLYYPLKSATFYVQDNSTSIVLPMVTLVKFTSEIVASQDLPLNTCFRFIQNAIDCALTYSVPLVSIQSGTYFENIHITPPNTTAPKSLEIIGADLPTIIDGSASISDPCLEVSVGTLNPLNLKLVNLTLQNGSQGIRSSFVPFVYQSADLQPTEFLVENCIVKDNGNTIYSTEGIGVHATGPISLIKSKFHYNSGIHEQVNNMVSTGGGAYLINDSIVRSTIITGCEFIGNSASQSGGLHLTGTGRFEVTDNYIMSNFRRDDPVIGSVNNVFCESVSDLDIYGNLLINDISPNAGSGDNLTLFECGTGLKPGLIRNNTISGNLTSLPINSNGLVLQGVNCFTVVYNNIIQNSSVGILKTNDLSQLQMRNCLFWDNLTDYTGVNYNSVVNPGCLFGSDPSLDACYQPIWNTTYFSHCIDAGIGENDPDGTPPDIGARKAIAHQYWDYSFTNQADLEKWYWVSYPVLNSRTSNMLKASTYFEDLLMLHENTSGNMEPTYLDEIDWMVQSGLQSLTWLDQDWTQNQSTHYVSSPQGYKIKMLPRSNPNFPSTVTLKESGFKTSPYLQFPIYGGHENWLGYFKEEPSWPHEAFATIWDDINMIKTKNWCIVRANPIGDYWGMHGKVSTLKYGDMVVVTTNNDHSFRWNNTDIIEDKTIATPVHFTFDEKQDYVPVYVTVPDSIMIDLKEIGIYLDGVCKGAVVIENNIEQICTYLGIDEKLTDGVVEFVFYYHDNKSQNMERRTIRMDKSRFVARYVNGSTRYPFYDISISKADMDNVVPPDFSLSQNYPNPFNPSTTISYQLPKSSSVKLEVYNLKGQKVKTLVDANQVAGYHNVIWNGTDTSNRNVASGVYLYRLSNPSKTISKRMLLMK